MLFQKLTTARSVMFDKGVSEMSVWDFVLARPFEEPLKKWLSRAALTLFPERKPATLQRGHEALFARAGVRLIYEGERPKISDKVNVLKRVKFVLIGEESKS